MPGENSNITNFLNFKHHFAEDFSSWTLGAFRLLKFLKDFKIFSARKFTKLYKLGRNTHHLLIIIFGALASIEKIFWFVHIYVFGFKKRNYQNLIYCFPPALHFRPHPQGETYPLTLQRACGALPFCAHLC